MNFNIKLFRLMIPLLIAILFWWVIPVPSGVSQEAWQLLTIFLATILAVILDALPMGASTLIGLTVIVLTKTMSFEQAFSGYSNETTWLIVLAFFIAHGFIKTGLGRRVAHFFVGLFGKSSLGLGYGLALSEVFLAPAIPSMTARTGAIIYPIAQALAEGFDSRAKDGTRKKIGRYLMAVTFQAAVVSSAMFMTAMAANPLVVKLAAQAGVQITWGSWALYAVVPGLCSIIVIPLLVYLLNPPEIKNTAHAALAAKEQLQKLGPMSVNEKIMAMTFFGLLFFWIFGSYLGVSAVVTALLGVSFLVITGVLSWNELLKISSAWETFVWFGALVAMAEGLNNLKLTTWFGDQSAAIFSDSHWMMASAGLLLIYFYSHYLFASSTAHVGALYLPFLLVAIRLGAPPLQSALILGYASNLYMGLTHYGCGPAPILFGSGYVSLKEWWSTGAIVSIVNLVIWLLVGGAWWTFLS